MTRTRRCPRMSPSEVKQPGPPNADSRTPPEPLRTAARAATLGADRTVLRGRIFPHTGARDAPLLGALAAESDDYVISPHPQGPSVACPLWVPSACGTSRTTGRCEV